MSEQSFSTISEDEISLKNIIDFLADSWKAIMLCAIAGGLLGLGGGVRTPPTYQATAYIQVTKVAGIEVEAPATLVEKLKMPTYYSEKTHAACNVLENLEAGAVISSSLKPAWLKTAPIITISYRQASPEDAEKCLEGVLDDVQVNQRLIAKPIFESKTNQLVNLKLRLESAQKIVNVLPKPNTVFDFSDSKFSASTLLLTTILSKENEVKDLQNQINDLEISLSAPHTKEAFLTTPIYSPKKNLSPKPTRFLLMGLMSGVFIGLLLMMGKRAYSAYGASN
jgi:capsular polysaccharide biosynthesis protein